MQFAHWALDQYGGVFTGNTVWGRLINTDFSAMVKKNGTLNTRVDGVWSKSMLVTFLTSSKRSFETAS